MCFEHYEEIQYILKPRPVVMDNINRLIRCGDPDYGGALFICPECGEIKFVPYRCHSKLCSTCGAIYSLKRAQTMQSIMIDVKHRHIVFTIDEALRPFFLHDRSLLNLLFDSVEEVLTCFFQNIAHKTKCEILRPGFTMTLHTFDPLNGIHIFTFYAPKVPLINGVHGALWSSSLMSFFENLFKRFFLINYVFLSVLLFKSKKFPVINIIRTVSMSMPSPS
ncbi:hypothetical protein HMPREF9998_00565 [Peptostreptococcus anaerobius VPI 4330 = DSM 2949]|nr:hypothetical protein HMPREF9998_00565 [Peptostreptococcus anaerobius VPI 4330 = DSM 2949]